MVPYIIGFILIIIALIITGLIFRKFIYDRVDKLEAWKMDIMNRNVTAELQRVKALRLAGETQTKFESWKETWDRILTRDLPDIEEYLFDAEEAADRFKVPSANKSLETVEQILNDTEKMIENMYSELDDLLDSEKQSRKLAEEVIPQLKNLRNILLQNLHAYGEAEARFEAEINDQQKQLEHFYYESEQGNYYEARQIINDIKQALIDLEDRLESFPAIYRQCKVELPEQIHQLKNGIEQMKEDGYQIEHHNFQKELRDLEEQLAVYVTRIEEQDDQTIFDFVVTIEERIQEIYAILEEESKARSYVDKHLQTFEKLIEEVVDDFKATDEEVTSLQKTYYLEGSDLELHENLEKWVYQLERQHIKIKQDLAEEQQTYKSLKDDLEVNYQDLQKLKEAHLEFKAQISTIRKDEIEAKEKIQLLQRKLFEINRDLEKSNLPGIPSFIWNQMEEATDKCNQVLEKFTEEPLDMGKVNHSVKEATSSVESLVEQTETMIEQAYLIERIIQYANRYRSQYPVLSTRLSEAEKLFRECQYEQALEVASESLENIEPGALSRLEIKVKVPS
ncbi:septation ring formation regulator EzrA [Amphibacillus indicireducens]|uniref:Septation ring formation regulator EzrA n=1 Tax=Amphibacillus indicireducens TaxID=1076330 RepID=A0ABP7VSN8_9BACI